MKIMFLIRSLDHGGAQRQLVTLAKGLKRLGHQVTVVTFYPGKALEKDLIDAHIVVRTLGKRGRWDIARSTFRLLAIVRSERPQFLHGYLGTANLLTIIPRLFVSSLKLIWGIRASDMNLNYYDWLVRLSFLFECSLSTFADLIIANSQSGRDYYVKHGFPSEKIVVIHNGIDVERFKPDLQARKRVRSEWGISEKVILIGNVARLDPITDHFTFLSSAQLLARARADVRFVCIGDGHVDYREQLLSYASRMGLEGRLSWVGTRTDMPAVYNALDVLVSSSTSEGFPNALGEAMACGVPCVATNAGDSALILNTISGRVVPIKDSRALADGIICILESGRTSSASVIRRRISEVFHEDRMVRTTEQAVMSLVCR
jgi:glycosyltransferase involved in cell wall biosynthesis